MSTLSTISNEYYIGMTKEDAERKNLYKKSIGIDFFDIDKNNDGLLDKFEILDARKKESRRNEIRTIGKTLASSTMLLLSCAPKISPCFVGISLIGKLLGVAGLVWSFSDINDNIKENEKTEKEIKNYS